MLRISCWLLFLAYRGCFTRLFIKAPAGRKRFNVLGALNAVTHELITVTNDTYINAQSFCDLLRRISRLNIGVPITLVLDNARYQKCKPVWALAGSLNIELLYIPLYSPNLNFIERLWKFVKKQCLYSKYYSEFKDFKFRMPSPTAWTRLILRTNKNWTLYLHCGLRALKKLNLWRCEV